MGEVRGSREIAGRILTGTGDFASAPIEVVSHSIGSLQATWSGLTSLDAVLNIQLSNDKLGWNDARGGNAVNRTLDTASGTQVWEIKRFSTKYVRLFYTENSNAAGDISFLFLGSDR